MRGDDRTIVTRFGRNPIGAHWFVIQSSPNLPVRATVEHVCWITSPSISIEAQTVWLKTGRTSIAAGAFARRELGSLADLRVAFHYLGRELSSVSILSTILSSIDDINSSHSLLRHIHRGRTIVVQMRFRAWKWSSSSHTALTRTKEET